MRKLILVMTVMLISTANAKDLPNDEVALRKLNVEISAAEDRGDRKWLAGVLGSELAFRRANGVVVDRARFLDDIKSRGESKTVIESVNLYGARAVVTCFVTLQIDGQDAKFHNLRLFIREGNDWKLLGWANERVPMK